MEEVSNPAQAGKRTTNVYHALHASNSVELWPPVGRVGQRLRSSTSRSPSRFQAFTAFVWQRLRMGRPEISAHSHYRNTERLETKDSTASGRKVPIDGTFGRRMQKNIPVTLARFQKNAPEYSFQWLPLLRPDDPHEHLPDPEVEQLDFDTESSSTSSGSDSLASATSTKTATASVDIQVCCQADEELFAKCRKVIHARVATTDDNDVRPFYRHPYWKAALGARTLHVETDILPACGMQENLGLHPSGITQFEIFGTA